MSLPDLVPFAAGAALMVASLATIRAVLHRRQIRRWRERGQWVSVAAPPEIDPDGAVQLWRHLAQIERGPWKRWWCGQPHLIFEYRFDGPRLRVRIWVPGGVSVPLVRHAVAAAWPGAAVTNETETELGEWK
ncbi:hypothetical protein [Glycomyces sp. L485]|uniref:hypothetical protein n=1 Tax=Glycomyces sp. L485 TaxID=2909235 RepID=UPI001F4BA2B7|nr:hypothetical protein [Glycomyces sp. L485]